MIFQEALSIADKIVDQLKPICDIINIAGSIRRLKEEVGDIEIVCLPKKIRLKDMFDWDEGVIVDHDYDKVVTGLGSIIKGNTDGKYIQIELPQGIKLDLFMPSSHDYFRQFAIRTGSADYSKKIAQAWNRLGWVGTPEGLRLRTECRQLAVTRWICMAHPPTLPPVWKSEEEFFTFLNMKWIEPKWRL